jgi:hypothetical protein
MSLVPAPRPASPKYAPVEPCLVSFQAGAKGESPLETRDPIMACMGAYFARREAARQAEMAERLADARRRLAQG